MAVKIITERKFKAPPRAEDIRVINELRIKAMAQKGYISGETLVETEDDRKIVVISVWSGLEQWKTWVNSEERREMEDELTQDLEEPAKIRPFLMGVDCLEELFEEAMLGSERQLKDSL